MQVGEAAGDAESVLLGLYRVVHNLSFPQPPEAEVVDSREIAAAFLQVATLATVPLSPGDLRVEFAPPPHRRPARLPVGSQGVYAFFLGEVCLKVGKAGPQSAARYCSQHYGVNASSTLGKSILSHPEHIATLLGPGAEAVPSSVEQLGSWIEAHTSRLNVLIPSRMGPFALSLLEGFLQCRLHPLFEGPRGLNLS